MARNRIEVPGDLKEYTSFTSDIDLTDTAESPIATGHGAFVIDVIDAGSGSLVVRMAGNGSVDRTLTVASGDRVEGWITAIDNTSNVSRVRVGWSLEV